MCEGHRRNKESIQFNLDRSLMMVTALVPFGGYDVASEVAKKRLSTTKRFARWCWQGSSFPPLS